MIEGGGSPVKQAEFNRWLSIAARSEGLPSLQPPAFSACRSASGRSQRSCRADYERIKKQTMKFLISSRWLEGEARRQGIQLTPSRLNGFYLKRVKDSFKSQAEQRAFLKQSGMTESDLRFRSRVDYLSTLLTTRYLKSIPPPSSSQVAEYYTDNLRRFETPASRDILLIRTPSRSEAQKARSALDGGESFSAVARRFSRDTASLERGGRLRVTFDASSGPQLERLVGSAPKGVVIGPRPADGGFVLFRVLSDIPARRRSIEDARPVIERLLSGELRRRAFSRFLVQLESYWKPRTRCAEGYRVSYCS